MGDLSVAVLVGRLTRDAELKYTSSGQAVCKFSVATNSRVKKGDQWVDESSYWNVDLWGKKAESVNQYLTKGKLVAVSGDMRQDKWEKDGVQKMNVQITANDVQLLGSGGEGRGGQGGESRPSFGAQGGSDYRAPSRPDFRNEGGQDRGGPAPKAPYQQSGQAPDKSYRRDSPQPEQGPGGDEFTDDIPF